MLNDLFINACILIASISLGNLIFHTPEIDSTKNRVFVGILSGVLGIILMLFSVCIDETVILDFRNIAIILSAIYGGVVASIGTGLIIGFFRVVYFGITVSSKFGLLTAIVMGIGCGFISNLKIVKWKKWTLVTLFSLMISTGSFSILIKNKILLFNFLWPFWVGTALMSLIMYFYADRLLAYNLLFHNLKTDATIDFLTGLYNVRHYDRVINSAMLNAKERKESLSLLYLDIDTFKKINDTYGHSEGDAILRQFGQILKDTCRSVDFIFRKGGDEFAVLLLNCNSQKAIEVANRIRVAVEINPFQLNSGLNLKLTTSIGVASFPESVTEVEMLSEVADSSLYKAKHSGRNKVETP